MGFAFILMHSTYYAQIGKKFPSEKKIIKDPITSVELIFLTGTSGGDSKIYPTHTQWTFDGNLDYFQISKSKRRSYGC